MKPRISEFVQATQHGCAPALDALQPPDKAGASNFKSCGGVEGHALSYALAPQASAFADALVHQAGIKPGPQDNSIITPDIARSAA